MRMSRKERGKKLFNDLNTLADDLIVNPEEMAKFTKSWFGPFRNYSFNNTLLINFQKPGASVCAGYKTWQTKYNRHVKRGEKAIYILAPRKWSKEVENDEGEKETVQRTYFNPVAIFDLSQTAKHILTSTPLGQHIEYDDEWDFSDIDVGAKEYVQGEIDYQPLIDIADVPVEIQHRGHANGATDYTKIYMTPTNNNASFFSTLSHEIGHIRLGHKKASDLGRATRELEAEAVAYLVTTYFGLKDEKSRLYIASWKGDKKELLGRGKKILSVAESIIKDYEHKAGITTE